MIYQFATFIGCKSMFGFFSCHMDFQQDTDDSLMLGRLFFDFIQ